MLQRLYLAVFLAVSCLACQSSGEVGSAAPQTDSDTELRTSVESIFDDTSLLILGEVHGTNEGPSFALAAVEAAVEAGYATALGLEIDDLNQGAVDRYLASAGTEADREALVSADHWEFGSLDGRGSFAMLEMIDGIRKIGANGQDVRVHCFRPMVSVEQFDQMESLMAGSLIDFMERHPSRKVVVLVGNVHASIATSEESAPNPMAAHLLSAHPGLVNVDMRSGGGEAWCWMGDAPGVEAMGVSGDSDAYGIELFGQPDERGFRGAFDVGVMTAAMPVKPGAYERLLKDLDAEPKLSGSDIGR